MKLGPVLCFILFVRMVRYGYALGTSITWGSSVAPQGAHHWGQLQEQLLTEQREKPSPSRVSHGPDLRVYQCQNKVKNVHSILFPEK